MTQNAEKTKRKDKAMKKEKKVVLCAILVGLIVSANAASSSGKAQAAVNIEDDISAIQVSVAQKNSRAVSLGVLTEEVSEDIENTNPSQRAIPSGAYKMSVNINGRDVLDGRVFAIGSTTYVPLFRFCDWLGVFTYSYNKSTGVATVKGTGLEISASKGALYISANGRYFYTVDAVLDVGGEIYVPVRPITKALNSKVEWSSSEGKFKVYSGDTRLLKTGAQVYREDEIYWLSRIINAEAGGEPLKGKIAVGNVILNRVRSSQFPNTIYSVIFDKKYGVQFAPTSNGTVYKTPNAESIIAAKMCIEGYSLSTDVLYFVNPQKSPSNWISNNRPYAFTVANHAFYY